MRITGGKLGGQRIQVMAQGGPGFRPTMDFIRESMFSSLSSRLDLTGLRVLDLFSGTGIIAFECISRGAQYVRSVEQNSKLCKLIEANSKKLGIDSNLEVFCGKFEEIDKFSGSFDLVIADPPYGAYEFHDLFSQLSQKKAFSEVCAIIFEERASKIVELSEQINGQNLEGFVLVKSKVYSDSGYVILFRIGQDGE